jgi:hypothetical protein
MHLPRPYAVLIGSQLWEFPRPYSWQRQDTGGWQIMGNYLYVCPVCATAWARAWATDLPTEAITWELFEHLPPALLQRELDLHLRRSTTND